MSCPKASIIWLNHNSASFADTVIESLEGIKNLDYPNSELIIVDNGSTDNSLGQIKDLLGNIRLTARIIELTRNLGFDAGVNTAFKARAPDSKYVVLLNNDAVPYPRSLSRLVQEMEMDDDLGAAQGAILSFDETRVDTIGDFIDEFLLSHLLLKGNPVMTLAKALNVSYVDGAYAIYRNSAIEKVYGRGDKMFDEEMFAYFDDSIVGLKLWNSGFKVKTFPFIAAKHHRSLSFGKVKVLQLYLNTRGHIATNEICNSKYKGLVRFYLIKIFLRSLISKLNGLTTDVSASELLRTLLVAFQDGKRMGRRKHDLGERIDIYRAPLIRLTTPSSFLYLATKVSLMEKKMLEDIRRSTNSSKEGEFPTI